MARQDGKGTRVPTENPDDGATLTARDGARDWEGFDDDAIEAMRSVRNWEGGTGFFSYYFNPVVTFAGVILIWGFVIACMVQPDHMLKALTEAGFNWIAEVWTWFYIVSQDIWIVVLVWLMIPERYGNIVLGKEGEPPAYSFPTWFALLFAAGVAVGLFYYSVAEPVWHYKGYGGARWSADNKGYGNDNEDAMHALLITWFHWGIHGWVPYTTMGGVLAIMAHRRGFPMSIRYCFYPLIGKQTHGWMGDVVDTLSIVTTLFGVCTSLGLGAMQVNMGLQRLNHGFYAGVNYGVPSNMTIYSNPTCGGTGQLCDQRYHQEPFGIQTNFETQVLIIVCITLAATASVISGMNLGIVNLSRLTLALGMFLMLVVLFLGETYYIMNVITQVFGYYLWYLPKLSFQTDAFEQLGSKDLGLGGAPDDQGGSSGWLNGWTLFYWGWWISWGPFVGTFIAKISKGRTLRQFIIGTLVVPSVYSFIWFGIFGAEGIRMQRMADGSGLCTQAYTGDMSECQAQGGMRSRKCVSYAASYNLTTKQRLGMGWNPKCVLEPAYHDGHGKCKEFEWTRKVPVAGQCVKTTTWVKQPCGDHPDPTYMKEPPKDGAVCEWEITMAEVDPKSSKKNFNHFHGKRPPCFVPLDDSVVCLYNQETTDILFDQMASYGPRGFSDFICLVTMFTLILYFVTSSDSGSYVIDMISANGNEDPPIIQRVFWSLTEGATAIALLFAGKNLPDSTGSLKALQCASLFMGLPYTFILFWCCQALVLAVKEEAGDLDKNRKRFKTFIFNGERPWRILSCTISPGTAMGRIIFQVGGWPGGLSGSRIFGMLFQFLYLASIVLLINVIALYEWCIIGLVVYIGFGTFLGFLRNQVRTDAKISRGDLVTDIICGCACPMFTILQLEVELDPKIIGEYEMAELGKKDPEAVQANKNGGASGSSPDLPLRVYGASQPQ